MDLELDELWLEEDGMDLELDELWLEEDGIGIEGELWLEPWHDANSRHAVQMATPVGLIVNFMLFILLEFPSTVNVVTTDNLLTIFD